MGWFRQKLATKGRKSWLPSFLCLFNWLDSETRGSISESLWFRPVTRARVAPSLLAGVGDVPAPPLAGRCRGRFGLVAPVGRPGVSRVAGCSRVLSSFKLPDGRGPPAAEMVPLVVGLVVWPGIGRVVGRVLEDRLGSICPRRRVRQAGAPSPSARTAWVRPDPGQPGPAVRTAPPLPGGAPAGGTRWRAGPLIRVVCGPSVPPSGCGPSPTPGLTGHWPPGGSRAVSPRWLTGR